MDSRNKRLSKAAAAALAFHVLAAAVIGALGIQNRENLPPRIIEITLDAGGGGGGGNRASESSGGPAILKDISDIVEKAEHKENLEPEKEQEEIPAAEETEVQEERGRETSAMPSASGDGGGTAASGEGTGSGGGQGSGEGSGSGSGEGEGEGGGTGSGSGGGNGEGAGMAVTAPMVISSVRPNYPRSAINAEVEGVAYVTLSVDASGNVTGAVIAGSTGNPALDRAAVEAAYQWRFSPALDRYGQPSPCHITIPFQFSLHN
ncbi:energy transducer TonB [uncultured Dialister sp.]|uniref:energy transducer TonB n=1 Tax=uncultured Dialister sp. TaxID=278064 RepID=UPI002674F6B4|nr:energy transducer TonB [uncultured Dialister sp.]